MNIHESCLALIRVDSRFQRALNRTCVQRIENAHETRIGRTNTRASVYTNVPLSVSQFLALVLIGFWVTV